MGISLWGIIKGLLVQEESDRTKQLSLEIDAAATTATKTILKSAQTANRTLDLPDATDTLVGKATTDVLTNKSIDADNNPITNLAHGAEVDNPTSGVHGVAGTVVGTSDSQTLTNKTIDGDDNTVQDLPETSLKTVLANASKFFTRDASGIPESTAKAVPTGTVVGTSDAQTLTNKNITSPTGIVKGDVGLGNVDNTSDATKDAASATLTNKTIGDTNTINAQDDAFTIDDPSDATKQIDFDAAGTTSTKTTIASSQTTNRTLTLPDATDTLVGKATTDALTNKDIDGGTATDASRLTVPKATKATLDALTRKEATLVYADDLNKLFADDGTDLKEIGSGGTGGINYAKSNPDAEVNTDGYQVYADAAGVQPVDGTGGSPTVTLTRTTTTAEILRGDASFKFAKDAANRQGEGFNFGPEATDKFTIDIRDKGNQIEVSFDYNVSANYVGSDMQFYVYDILNSKLISVRNDDDGFLLSPSTNGSTFLGSFTATDSVEYRLIGHVATVSALAYDVFFDNVRLGPGLSQPGFLGTEWVDFDMTIDAVTTAPTKGSSLAFDEASWRRVGDSMEIKYTYLQNGNAGAAIGSGIYLFQIPNGETIDTTKLATAGNTGTHVVGSASVRASTFTGTGYVKAFNSTGLSLEIGNEATAPGAISSTFFTITNTDIGYSFVASVPIEGWAATAAISTTQANLQTTKLSVYRAAALSTTDSSPHDLVFDTIVQDTHGGFNVSTGKYTVQSSGDYLISVQGSAIMNDGEILNLKTYRDSTSIITQLNESSGTGKFATISYSKLVTLEKDELIKVEWDTNTGNSRAFDVGEDGLWMTIQRVPDFNTFSVLGKSELIETILAADHVAFSPGINVWQQPNSSFAITLKPGTYDLNLQGMFGVPTATSVTGNQVTADIALATSDTASVGIFKTFTGHHHSYSGTNWSYQFYNLDHKNYIVTEETTIYVHFRYRGFSGSPTILSLGFRAESGSGNGTDPILSARRIS